MQLFHMSVLTATKRPCSKWEIIKVTSATTCAWRCLTELKLKRLSAVAETIEILVQVNLLASSHGTEEHSHGQNIRSTFLGGWRWYLITQYSLHV